MLDAVHVGGLGLKSAVLAPSFGRAGGLAILGIPLRRHLAGFVKTLRAAVRFSRPVV